MGSSDRRSSRQHRLQRLNYLKKTLATVGLRIRLRLPEAVTDGLGEIRRDKDNLIQESLLLAQHGNYLRLNQAGKFGGGLGFESNYYVTSKHTYAFVLELLGQIIWLIPEEPEKECAGLDSE